MSATTLVILSACLATFVASVMADDQTERLRNGTFGTIAGATVGGLAAWLSQDNVLVLYGVFGSVIGATIGWAVYLILAFIGSRPWGRRLVEYHVRGLKGVHERLISDERELLRQALSAWGQTFSRSAEEEKALITARQHDTEVNYWIRIAVKRWLSIATDTFNLVLDALVSRVRD
jgi:uncharacterized membrane protein YccC